MKTTPFALASAILSIAFAATAADEWPGVKYTEVRAYAWPANNADSRAGRVVQEDMTIKDGAVNKQGAPLSAEQTKRLIAAVNGTHDAYSGFGCFEPHNAFVFYDADKKPVAFLEVCFLCLRQKANPAGVAPSVDLAALAAIFGELKLPMGKYADAASFEKRFNEYKSRTKERQDSAADSKPKTIEAK